MKHKRFILGIFLAGILILLMLYSSLECNNKDPGIRHILENFEMYNNTKVSFTGEIAGVNRTNKTLTIWLKEPPYSLMIIEIDNLECDLQEGNIVEILGVLDGEKHVTAEKILASTRWQYDLIYIRSLPAIPFALYLFFRTWKFNSKTWRFERRRKNA